MHGRHALSARQLEEHPGKSAPAAMVSGMPPEKRGLISKTRPRPRRHAALDIDGAEERQHPRPFGQIDQAGRAPCARGR